jgi:hypothetical protein
MLMTGPNQKQLTQEMQSILDKFGGKIIPPKVANGWETRDVLGATWSYRRTSGEMSLTMSEAIDRLLLKFDMAKCRTAANPCEKYINLEEGAVKENYPLRRLVGALLHIQVVCRPDISFAVQRVARMVTRPTENAIRAGLRILQYLKGTKSEGLRYSPRIEADFWEVYGKLAKAGGKDMGDLVAFSDADYAGCQVTLKSTSGSILYFKGVPIAWKARRQSVRAASTCESEYVACHDTIHLTRGQGIVDFMLGEEKLPLIFCDNESAIKLAGSSVITKKSKHIAVRFHTVRDHFRSLCFVNSELNKADPLTKGGKHISLFHHKLADAGYDEQQHLVENVGVGVEEEAKAFFSCSL